MTKFKIVMIITFILALLTFNASAGCGRWVVRDNTDYLKDPTFDALINGEDENASGSSSQDSVQAKAKDNGTSAKNAPDSNIKANNANVLDVSGKWLVDFGDNSTPLNLILIQSGSRVQGYGSLKENGAEIPVTALGSLSGDVVSLEVKLVTEGSVSKTDKKNKLQLVASNGILTGAYETYLADKLEWKGDAVATRL